MTETQDAVYLAGVSLWEKYRCPPSIRGTARMLSMPVSTVQGAFGRLKSLVGDEWWRVDESEVTGALSQDEDDTQGGKRTITSGGSVEPVKVDDLLQRFDVNPDEWEVDRSTVTVARSVKGADSYRTVIYLKRNESAPVLIENVFVAGVHAPMIRSDIERDTDITVVIPDLHIGWNNGEPMHDRKAITAMIHAIRFLKPSRLICVGDLVDVPEFGRYVKYPEFLGRLKDSFREASWLLQLLREIVGDSCKCDWILGNHEERFRSYLATNAPALLELVTDITDFISHNGWDIHGPYPIGKVDISKHLGVVHGEIVGAQPGDTVKKMAQRYRRSVIQGHIHRTEQVYSTRQDSDEDDIVVMTAIASMCHRERVPSASANLNWQKSFGLVYHEPDDGDYQVQTIPVFNGRCIVEGRVFEGEDYGDEFDLMEAEDAD